MLLGAAMWAWALWRPLPPPETEPVASPPRLDARTPRDATLDERERVLASLNRSGNVFAPDRQPWEEEASTVADAQSKAEENGGAESGPGSDSDAMEDAVASAPAPEPGEAIDIAQIEIEEDPPPNLRKELENLLLRGVYATDRGAAALIGHRRSSNKLDSPAYRVGDLVGEGEAAWRVLAIDPVDGRVIVQREGVNLQLRLYPPVAGAPRAARRGRSAVQQPVFVQRSSPEVVRRRLAEEGLSEEAIDELLARAAAAPGETPSGETAPPAGPENAGGSQTAEALTEGLPEAPPGFAELLKMMASGSAPGGDGGSSSDEGEPEK